jgi:hypothetical protein
MPKRLVMPDFPDDFTADQLDALRDLTCYALGFRPYKKLFPEDSEDGLPRPGDGQIGYFKDTGVLDYRDSQVLVRTVYTRVFAFLSEQPSRHTNLRHLIEIVYPQPNTSQLESAAAFAYPYFHVNPRTILQFIKQAKGLYYLYRYGERAANATELVKSVLAIYGQGSGDKAWLEFRLSYRGGRLGEIGQQDEIRGIIIPSGIYFYFMGADQGTGRVPCLMITGLPMEFKARKALHGVLLRLNTLNHISATRTFCVRTDNADRTNEAVLAAYKDHLHVANIYSKSDQSIQHEIDGVLPNIDNTVDMVNQFTLRDLRQHDSDT